MKMFEYKKQLAKDLNCDINELIDFSSSINFLKPNINIDFNSLDTSVSPNYEKLNKKISNNYNLNINQFELFNGHSSSIFALFKYLNLTHCTLYSPINMKYKKACINFGYQLRTINRFEDIYLPVKADSLIVFLNPSFPDGKYYDMEKLIAYWKEQNCTILIDESFLPFCEGESCIKYLNNYEKIYILKSLTKFYGSDGVNVSLLISTIQNIEKLKRFETSWKISIFDVNYLQSAFEDRSFKSISKAINLKNKIELEKILKSSNLVDEVFDSNVNYFLIKLKNITAKEFQEKLKTFKILVENCSDFDFLDENYMKISVKDSKSNKTLKEAFEKIC